MKVIIIGGVAGGASCAARLRRLNENAQIDIYERTGYISYANCGLPYYIGGSITDPEELTLQDPESFWSRFRINAHVKHEVTAIDSVNKKVTVLDLETGREFEDSYDKLVLSPGAKPTVPGLTGVSSDKIFTLRTVEDTFRIFDFVKTNNPKSAVVAGGGFIGLEMAENLRELGLDVTIVEMLNQLLKTVDRDMASFVHTKMRENGVNLMLETAVEGFEEDNNAIITKLKDKDSIKADMVILSIGVTPDTQLAKMAGLELGIKNSILVNDRMETSVPDIYAVGDAVEVKHIVTGNQALISLAGPANKQGRIAADNICGINSVYKGSQGSSVIKIFDITAASTGIGEFEAKNLGIDYESIVLSPNSHASYYPDAMVMTMKVLFEKNTTKLLGAQIIGSEGVDKHIDVMATAINAGLNGLQLKDLDLAYAPPYSSAKDPVNMAGFMIENITNGVVKQFHIDDIPALSNNPNVTLIDSRTDEEYAEGHAPGFINLPVDEIRDHIDELDKSKPVYIMCHSGVRSYITCRILTQYGFDCYNFSGGYRFYSAVVEERQVSDRAYPCGIER